MTIWKKKLKDLKRLKDCLKCRKNTERKIPKVVKTKNGRIMLLSKYDVCDSKKSKLIKDEEV